MTTLHYENDQYVFRGDFASRALPKDARFRWNPTDKIWWTDDIRKAATLAVHAVGEARTRLGKHLAEVTTALAASRAQDTDIHIPVPAGRTLYPYQKAGVAYAQQRVNTLIADDMGLGKSCQSLVLINTDPSIHRVLIICPASLKINWMREARMWLTGEFSIGIAEGNYFPPTDIVICNFDIVERHRPNIDKIEWDYLIVDEAHYIKSQTARRTCAVLGGTIKVKAKAKPKAASTTTTATKVPSRMARARS